ncbi:helix-turn-helix transcriptional regulator [Rhodobacteraceae bacterium R_SAG2]|nr:helix-turn-helix transcriptional regulator [Rhodobacteraceae bacterium R_SAG2]
MTGEQVRAARALLKWSAKKLAEVSGVSYPTIQRLESKDGPLAGYADTHEAIRKAFEINGIQFMSSGEVATGPGVAINRDE